MLPVKGVIIHMGTITLVQWCGAVYTQPVLRKLAATPSAEVTGANGESDCH